MINVVQYNILSSKLATADFYLKCNPTHLRPEYRLEKIKNKLAGYIEKDAVFCLQEVPQTWSGELHDYFSLNNYSFITSLYGNFYNDYMGVALAYPNSKYLSTDTKVVPVGVNVPIPRKRPEPKYSYLGRLLLFICALYLTVKRYFSKIEEKEPFDEWTYSNRRANTIIMTKLTDKTTNNKAVLATYHMPCAYWAPKVLTIHTVEMLKLCQRYAGDLPLIIASDCNFKPDSYQYNIVTTGSIDGSHPEHPDTSALGMTGWNTKIKPMNSAYKSVVGKEPPLTTQTYSKMTNCLFKATLDYIFYTNIKPISTEIILDVTDETIYPNEEEPSDHLSLYVSFRPDE
jgi:mRNA deadenylase 3'-5' endonuclease subunit Ccr4